jgi:hypothetical protein
MPTTTQLYAWAVPAFIDESPVDHTWVTSYDNRTQNFADIAAVIAANQDYWFCIKARSNGKRTTRHLPPPSNGDEVGGS